MRFHLARAFFRFFSAAFRCFGVSLRPIVFFCSYTVIFFIQQQADRVQNGSAKSIVGCHNVTKTLKNYHVDEDVGSGISDAGAVGADGGDTEGVDGEAGGSD